MLQSALSKIALVSRDAVGGGGGVVSKEQDDAVVLAEEGRMGCDWWIWESNHVEEITQEEARQTGCRMLHGPSISLLAASLVGVHCDIRMVEERGRWSAFCWVNPSKGKNYHYVVKWTKGNCLLREFSRMVGNNFAWRDVAFFCWWSGTSVSWERNNKIMKWRWGRREIDLFFVTIGLKLANYESNHPEINVDKWSKVVFIWHKWLLSKGLSGRLAPRFRRGRRQWGAVACLSLFLNLLLYPFFGVSAIINEPPNTCISCETLMRWNYFFKLYCEKACFRSCNKEAALGT